MCAEKVVRFIKKCLRGEESSMTNTSSDVVQGCALGCSVHGSMSAGNSPADGHRRNRTRERSRRGLPDVLQSRNICSITASSFAKEKYQPLLDITPYDNFQSQPSIYSDTKGVRGDRSLCHQLPYRPHPLPPPHFREQLRTTLLHLPCQQRKTSALAPAFPANSQQFSQKHLHHLFPPSVHRSMDGEERYWTKRDAGALSSRSIGTSGPPPNRTIFS